MDGSTSDSWAVWNDPSEDSLSVGDDIVATRQQDGFLAKSFLFLFFLFMNVILTSRCPEVTRMGTPTVLNLRAGLSGPIYATAALIL